MSYNVIVIDQGSHSSRALAFDCAGNLLATSTVPVNTKFPKTSFVEQSPEEILDSVQLALLQLESLLSPEQINAIQSAALIVQRSSLLACNQSLTPLTQVVSWQDTRNQPLIQTLFSHADAVKAETGLRMNAHYGASKMHWMLENNSAVNQAAQNKDLLFVPLAAFIACKLVNARECVVDPVIASRTLLSKLGQCQWSSAMLTLFGIDKQFLPRIVPSEYPVGNIAFATHSIPLNLVGGDQSFIAFASGFPVDANTAYINVGTGAFVQMLDNGLYSRNDLLFSPLVVNAKEEAIIVIEGTVNAAATALDWLWENAGTNLEYEDLNEALLSDEYTPPIFINTLAGTGSPYWLPAQAPRFMAHGNVYEGAIFLTTAILIEAAIAVVESIIFALMDNMHCLFKQNPELNCIITGGGMSQSDGFCQKLSNLSGLYVARPKMHEISARGAAMYLLKKQQSQGEIERDNFYPQEDKLLQQRYNLYVSYIERNGS